MTPDFKEESFPHAWFIYDGESNPGQGAAIVVFYCYLKTDEPMFNFSIQPTSGSKIEIYE